MPDRRTAILDAAIAVIARHGIRGLRVEEVAAAANVAVSLLYYYFDTRDGLVRATLDHANDVVDPVVGADVVEVIPRAVGSADPTALLGDRVVREVLHGIAETRVGRARRGEQPIAAAAQSGDSGA